MRTLPLADWLPPAIAFALAQLVRHLVVEPPAFQHACDPAPWAGWCAGRMLLIQTFATQGLGWLALAGGMAALLARTPAATALAARVALASGAAGLVLYCFEPSAVGVLLAALALVRRDARRLA